MCHTILIVDDDDDIRELLTYNLLQENYKVEVAKDGQDALKVCKDTNPHLLIIDIMMPGLDGIETCRQLRSNPQFDNLIIVFLTARSEEYSEVAAFEAGADDFITKPIRPRALLGRIKAAFNRDKKGGKIDPIQETIMIGDLKLDIHNYSVKKGEKDVPLSKKEFEILLFLVQSPNQYYNREQLLINIWGKNVFVLPRTIDVHVRKIREKLGKDYIQTKSGVGYKFNEE